MDQGTHEVESIREDESEVWIRRAYIVGQVVSIVIAVLGTVKAAQTVQTSLRERRRAALVQRRLRAVQAA